MKEHIPTESVIVRNIIRKLTALGCIVRKRHGNAFQTAGDPDVYGVLPANHQLWPHRHFEIEVKRPGATPTALQVTRLAQWEKAGAIVGVAWSVEDALRILKMGNWPKTLAEIFAEEEDKKLTGRS